MAGGRRASRGGRSGRAPGRDSDATGAWRRGFGLLLIFGLVALAIYAPSLDGPFVSDDLHYVPNNPYVRELTPARALELLHPRGEPVRLVENYAPLHLLLHGLEWKLFGERVRGYHLVNVGLHAAVSVLLVMLLGRAGVPPLAATLGGAFFLVHPANVEAVAWISQLKTTSSLVLALGALLLRPGRPLLAALCFGLALLAKPVAALALPVAVVQLVAARRRDAIEAQPFRQQVVWLGVWLALFAAFAVAELQAFLWATAPTQAEAPDWAGRARMAASLVARYAWMATTSWNVSVFHSPPYPASWLDPWCLAGLAITGGVAARIGFSLRRGSEEAAWWTWAGVAFLPVAQFLPFRYPLADHYLYPILPGLIGGVLLGAPALVAKLREATLRLPLRASPRLPLRVAPVVVVAVLTLLAAFAAHAYERARLWSSPSLLIADAATNYPDSIQAHLLRARRAARAGRPAEVAAQLRGALDRGFDRFEQVLADPTLAPLASEPPVRRVLRDMAGRWVERYQGQEGLSQAELYSLGVAHQLREEPREAREAFEQALERGGPIDDNVRAALRSLGPATGSQRGASTRGSGA